MDQIEDVGPELSPFKGETTIVIKLKEGFKETKLVLTNHVSTSALKIMFLI